MAKLKEKKLNVKPRTRRTKVQSEKDVPKEENKFIAITEDSAIEVLRVIKSLQYKLNQHGNADGILDAGEELKFAKGIQVFRSIEEHLTRKGLEHESINW